MYDSSHDQNNYHFIELCFYMQACQWDLDDGSHAGWHAGKSVGQCD